MLAFYPNASELPLREKEFGEERGSRSARERGGLVVLADHHHAGSWPDHTFSLFLLLFDLLTIVPLPSLPGPDPRLPDRAGGLQLDGRVPKSLVVLLAP